MVAVACDSFVHTVYQLAALVIPPPETIEEAEVPENTLRVPQSIVSNIKCE